MAVDREVAVAVAARKWDYSDLDQLPEADLGFRYEVLDGELFVTPSPRTIHQLVSKRLQQVLIAYFEERRIGEVFHAPIDVILGQHDILVPDLVVVTNAAQVSERGVEGAPAIAIEILSHSTTKRDRTLKSSRYGAAGVPHYWIVNPAPVSLECYRLINRRYALVASGTAPARVAHPDWPGLTIDLEMLGSR
jgi:Uma2 family endonuclease